MLFRSHSQLAIWVGGNHSNARGKPTFQKLVAAGIPNNPPRWPEATAIVKRILKAYKEGARDWERINEWIERRPSELQLVQLHSFLKLELTARCAIGAPTGPLLRGGGGERANENRGGYEVCNPNQRGALSAPGL